MLLRISQEPGDRGWTVNLPFPEEVSPGQFHVEIQTGPADLPEQGTISRRVLHEILDHLLPQRKILAVKLVRDVLNTNLRVAKLFVESYDCTASVPVEESAQL